MSLLWLSSVDFEVRNGKNGKSLCARIPGISLIMFYSNNCGYCDQLMPVFHKLPGTIMNCAFGVLHVGHNRNVVKMAEETNMPITFVPLVVLFVDGWPYLRYTDDYALEQIQRFVIEAARSVSTSHHRQQQPQQPQQQSTSTQPTPPPQSSVSGAAAVTGGVPRSGGGGKVCYLTFDEAYAK